MTTPYREADPLGPLVSEHAVTFAQQGIRVGVGIFCAAVALDCVAIPTIAWDKSRPIALMDIAIFGTAALIFGVLAFWAFSHFFKSRGERIEVREGGLRLRNKHRAKDIRWVDIASVGGLVWEAAGTTAPYLSPLWVDDNAGDRHRLPTHVGDPYSLGREIQARTFEQRVSAIENDLKAGKTVHFGRVSLDASRLLLGNEAPILRVDLKRVALSSRWIEVHAARGGKRIVPSEEVPNSDVLLALLSPPSRREVMPSSSS